MINGGAEHQELNGASNVGTKHEPTNTSLFVVSQRLMPHPDKNTPSG
ncbi:MAG: hypothetical protein F6K16_37605 [Symploca sp. SIO2B6]|nr:hypothetical protein [Symploca sp. SIO2B6]